MLRCCASGFPRTSSCPAFQPVGPKWHRVLVAKHSLPKASRGATEPTYCAWNYPSLQPSGESKDHLQPEIDVIRSLPFLVIVDCYQSNLDASMRIQPQRLTQLSNHYTSCCLATMSHDIHLDFSSHDEGGQPDQEHDRSLVSISAS